MALWSRSSIGLDIGSRTVKAVQLKKSGKRVELEKFGVAEIFPDAEKPSAPDAQRRLIVEAIKRCMHEAGISSSQVVTAVAGESIIVRYIPMVEMPEEELKNALQWEADEHIPFRIEDVNIDSAIIGRTEGREGGQVDVLLVCARKDLINNQTELLHEAGLSPSIIDVDSFAFLNCFDMNYRPDPTEVTGLVNIGGEITSISVFSGGKPRFSRDISIGGSNITSAIQQRLDLSLLEAESLKQRLGAPGSGGDGDEMGSASTMEVQPGGGGESLADTIRDTVESMGGGADEEGDSPEAVGRRTIRNTLSNLVGEIRRSIQFFENQARTQKVQRLVIGGGSVALKGLDRYLHSELKLPVDVIDPLKRIPVTGKGINADLLRENRHMLSVGIGLALRKVVD